MNFYLLPVLSCGPAAIERLMAQISPERIDKATHPGRFSPREVAAHLADWEPILLSRMKQCLESPESHIEGMDEGVRAVEMNYGQTDWQEQVRLFVERRRETSAWLKTLSAEQWQEAIVHSEKGRQTITDQANQLLGHDLYHIAQLCDALEGRAVGTW